MTQTFFLAILEKLYSLAIILKLIFHHFVILGLVLERSYWQRFHERRRIGAKHSFGRQLFGVSPQEALAKRQVFVHQEYHGTCPTFVLNILRIQ